MASSVDMDVFRSPHVDTDASSENTLDSDDPDSGHATPAPIESDLDVVLRLPNPTMSVNVVRYKLGKVQLDRPEAPDSPDDLYQELVQLRQSYKILMHDAKEAAQKADDILQANPETRDVLHFTPDPDFKTFSDFVNPNAPKGRVLRYRLSDFGLPFRQHPVADDVDMSDVDDDPLVPLRPPDEPQLIHYEVKDVPSVGYISYIMRRSVACLDGEPFWRRRQRSAIRDENFGKELRAVKEKLGDIEDKLYEGENDGGGRKRKRKRRRTGHECTIAVGMPNKLRKLSDLENWMENIEAFSVTLTDIKVTTASLLC